MLKRMNRIHIGLRTVKTAAAVVLAMIIVEYYGATTSKLIFAMLGAMTAVQPTFKDSVEASLAQVVGVIYGAIVGIVLINLPVPTLLSAGIGIVMVITLYNVLRVPYAPALACLIVVIICTTPEIQPLYYAFSRIWDTAIGLGVGMLVNMLIFPYDNSSQIRATVVSLEKGVIVFLEDMFDGDDILPDPQEVSRKIDTMAAQLRTFSNQRLLMRMKRQQQELDAFRACEEKARALLAQMEVLRHMGRPSPLTAENRSLPEACGANIRDERMYEESTENSIVTNYHVHQILKLRQELLDTLDHH